MRSISRSLKAFIVISVFCSLLFAQIPDPFDPLYDFEAHILRPAQAKNLHVLSCTVYQNGKKLNEIIYDGNGNILSDGKTKHVNKYNNDGKIDYINNYDMDNNQTSTTRFTFDLKGNRLVVLKEMENSESAHKYTYYYAETTPTGIFQEIANALDLELTEIKTEYGYSESGKLSAFRVSENRFKYPGKVHIYATQTLFHFENGLLNNAEGWTQDSPDNIVYESFKYSYDANGLLYKIQNSIDSTEYKDLESYTHYSNGLLKTRSTQDAQYEYKYEFMKTAHVNIEIVDDIAYPKLFQYSRNYDFKRLTKGPGKWGFDIYVPDLDIFILEISPEIQYPIIIEPGKTVNIKYADGKFVQLNNDPANNLIWEIEDHKRIRYMILTKEKAKECTKQFIVEKMIKNSTSPVFMYYSWIYDLRYSIPEKDAFDELADYMVGDFEKDNNIKLLKDHAMDMIIRYPNNHMAIRQSSFRK